MGTSHSDAGAREVAQNYETQNQNKTEENARRGAEESHLARQVGGEEEVT